MALTPEDVLNKHFTATQFRRGYDEQEVDDFLDEIVVELRRLAGELDDCRKSKGLPASTTVSSPGEGATEDAERSADERVAAARARAEQAEREADERAAAAMGRAEHAEREAQALSDGQEPAATEPDLSPAVAAAAGAGGAAGVLELAQRLHDEHVAKGEATRDQLITEAQTTHDQLLSEAQTRHDELLRDGQSRHDALLAEASAAHDQMITEARERSTGMVAEAQQRKQEVLEELKRERGELTETISKLRDFEGTYRSKLREYLEGQLDTLDKTGIDVGKELPDLAEPAAPTGETVSVSSGQDAPEASRDTAEEPEPAEQRG